MYRWIVLSEDNLDNNGYNVGLVFWRNQLESYSRRQEEIILEQQYAPIIKHSLLSIGSLFMRKRSILVVGTLTCYH